jgi:hypothetical protein
MGRLSRNFGKVTSFSKTASGLNFSSDFACAAIDFYTDTVVRVRFSTDVLTERTSYAVVADAVENTHSLEESADKLILSSAYLSCELDKADAKISFFNLSGQIINCDGLPVSWIGTEVSVFKNLFDDEKFVGLGEKTGPLNRSIRIRFMHLFLSISAFSADCIMVFFWIIRIKRLLISAPRAIVFPGSVPKMESSIIILFTGTVLPKYWNNTVNYAD